MHLTSLLSTNYTPVHWDALYHRNDFCHKENWRDSVFVLYPVLILSCSFSFDTILISSLYILKSCSEDLWIFSLSFINVCIICTCMFSVVSIKLLSFWIPLGRSFWARKHNPCNLHLFWVKGFNISIILQLILACCNYICVTDDS